MTEVSYDFEAFCHLEYGRLLGAMTLYTGDPELARDVAQEALARACADWRKVRVMDHPGPWLHRVATNVANTHFRRHRHERTARAKLGPQATVEAATTPMPMVLRDAVAQLARRQRTALILRYFVDMSVEETAEVMDCATHTVKKLTGRAIAALRRDPTLHDLLEDVDVS